MKYAAYGLMLLFLITGVLSEVYVRTVEADPATRTYTFSCRMDPENDFLRDWFIRPDNGDLADDPEEGIFLDETGKTITYIFKSDSFYHIGCLVVEDTGAVHRGDLHIDLRTSLPDPHVKAVTGRALSSTLECVSSDGASVNWDVVDAQTGQVTALGGGEQITHNVLGQGLFDYRCHLSNGKGTQLPVEYFDEGDPYFPTSLGVPDGVKDVWVRSASDTSNTTPNSTTIDSTTNITHTSGTNDTAFDAISIYTSIKDIPAICEGGSIVTDEFNGGRKILCGDRIRSLSISAWEKPDSGEKEYFEMYKSEEIGTGLKVCLGDTCISENGYAKSANYPITLGNYNTINNTNQTNATNSTMATPEIIVYNNLAEIQAICRGGTITADSFDGGRHIICSNKTNMIQAEAWEKPDVGEKKYFEIYKKSFAGDGLTICLADVCIGEYGYAKSSFYPIFLGHEGLEAPIWFSSGLETEVAPDIFHLEVYDINNSSHISTDFEVWINHLTHYPEPDNSKIWSLYNATGYLKYHSHTLDGLFEDTQRSQLDYNTTYKARARFMDTSGLYSSWSEWKFIKTFASSIHNGNLTWTAAPGFKVEKFASGFDLPVHIKAAPDIYQHLPERPYLYITELYGTIKVVYRNGSSSIYADNLLNFDPFGSITGGGQMGLTGLYADEITGDLYAGMVYIAGEEVKNKVVRFQTSEDGSRHIGSTIVIDNLPSSPSHQIQDITKGHDGRLYINLGDALTSSYAQSDTILAGKIISMNMDGSDVKVYAKGFRNPFGAGWRPGYGQLFVTDNAPDSNDRIVKVTEGGNYGWGLNDNLAGFDANRIFTTDVSPVDIEFNTGQSGFPVELDGRMYAAIAGPIYQKGETKSKHILEFVLDENGTVKENRTLVRYTGEGYGTPIGLAFADDGLFFTDIYGEAGFIGLGETEGAIYRVAPGIQSGEINDGTFRAGISIVPWYPKDTGTGIEYVFRCQGIDGSGMYIYDFDLGNGAKLFGYDSDSVYQKYPYGDIDYVISCTAHDLVTSKSANMVINPSKFIAG